MRVIDIQNELTYENSLEIFNTLVQLDEEYEAIIEANSRVIYEEDMVELEDLRINIFTNGGLVWGCNAICDKINDIKEKGVNVITRGYGIIASAGLRIFMQGDIREAGKSTWFMMHGCQVGLEGDLINTMEYGQFLKGKDEDFNKFMMENTNMTQELFDEYKGKDFWFDYKMAVDLGVITPIEEIDLPVLTVDDCVKSFICAGYRVKEYEEKLEKESRLTVE